MSILRQLAVLVVIAVAVFGTYYAWQSYAATGEQAAEGGRGGRGATLVEAVPAERRSMSTTIEAVGTTIAARSIQVVSLVDGRITQLNFQSGDKVEEGDILVELDRDMQEADLTEAEAAKTRADGELERAQKLFGNKIVTAARIEELTAAQASTDADLKRARRQLADRTIRAPFAGTVGLNRVDIGARITDNAVITTLDDLSHVAVEFAVPENLYGAARIGQEVEARSAAYPGRTFIGKVVEIDSRIDGISRSFEVRADMPNEDGALPAGMFMQVSLSLDGGEATVVPEEAVIAESGNAFLFVVKDGVASRIRIETGRRATGVVEITEGIDADAMVVTRGNAKLRDGMQVRLEGESGDQNG
ncbi:efflux RND transporter periplasmic adaptor subunit [Tepidamorphus sp. 3E244]|uniref:efflux RND transporter periplasmic adaptor subunit n=1 Tax=Tepidamorphus sp. 3E244 TaxID=3385498 RepID=UPI0038FC0697